MAASLWADHSRLDPIQLDKVAFALAEALAILLETLDFDRMLLLRREGLLQKHIQCTWEGDKSQMLPELAAVALPGDVVLAHTLARDNFSSHEKQAVLGDLNLTVGELDAGT